jgi:hypothetical protein
MWEWRIQDQIWIARTVPSPYPRAGHGMASVNTSLYASGGFVSCNISCQSDPTLFEASNSESFSYCHIKLEY